MYCNKLVSHFLLILILAGNASYSNVPLGAPFGWAPTLPANIRLGWKGQEGTNTLAYYNTTMLKNTL